MSRTFRRKNYEDTKRSSFYNRGRKTNGYYTGSDSRAPVKMKIKTQKKFEEDGCEVIECRNVEVWRWGPYIYRPMTDQERNEEYWRIHGESKCSFSWSREMNRWGRRNLQKSFRMTAKQEIIKYYKDDEYEPIIDESERKSWAYYM